MSLIYFYGSLPKNGESPIGGGEVGNLRTVRMLGSFGYTVKTIRKRRVPSTYTSFMRLLSYPFRFAEGIIKMLFVLLLGNRSSVVHISGFAGTTILNEYILVKLTKLLKYRLIYELRGGGIIEFYKNGSSNYRYLFSSIINKADIVFTQGKENIPLLGSLCDTPIFHYPNCVEESFYPKELPIKPHDTINLLYYGRIEKEKNILLIVDIAQLIQKTLPSVTLTIIGNGKEEYVKSVKKSMENKLVKGTYVFMKGLPHDKLNEILIDRHFYIFPSEQIREGQSNAVTEVMSYGIVPIASPQGFNRSTIGDDTLIVDKLSAESYAERIITIIRNDQFSDYSSFVYRRFMTNYTEKIVFDNVKMIYSSFMKNFNVSVR